MELHTALMHIRTASRPDQPWTPYDFIAPCEQREPETMDHVFAALANAIVAGELAPDLARALIAAHEREAALVEALIEQNELLRSAFQIASREGVSEMVATTNWDAFYNRVTVVLKRHHETVNAALAKHRQAGGV